MLKALSEHHLVPKHELLSDEEVQKLFSQFGIDHDNLPQISQEDPMAQELGAKVGNIIRITRNSPVAGETLYYRRVV
jgi:DNA-directed RNA polymerase subunit H